MFKEWIEKAKQWFDKMVLNRMNTFAIAAVGIIFLLWFVLGAGAWSRMAQAAVILVRLSIGGVFSYYFTRFLFKDIRPEKLIIDDDATQKYMFYRAITAAGIFVAVGMAV